MKVLNARNWSLDDDDEHTRRRINLRKAQSGAFAKASLIAAARKRDFALQDPSLTETERGWLLSDADAEQRRSKRQRACARNYHFLIREVAPNTTVAEIRRLWLCQRPTCGICTVIRARRLHDKVMAHYDRAMERLPGLRALELTVTQPATPLPDLALGIDKLHRAIRSQLKSAAFEVAFAGSFRRTEISFNPTEQHWHVHAHLLLMAYPEYFNKDRQLYLSQERLMELWARAIGITGFVSVNIRPIRHPETRRTDPGSVRFGLWHVAKYATKPASLFKQDENGRFSIEPEIAEALSQGIHGKRMHAFAGVMASRWRPKR